MSDYLTHMGELGASTAFSRRIGYLKYNFRKFLRDLTPKSKVLEIGPGKGELLQLLNDQGVLDIDIIDNDLPILNYCQANFKIKNAIHATKLDITQSLKRKYDLVVLTQVFEHIPKSSYLNWVRGLYSALSPGGHIIITVPNGANPLVGTERYGDLQHENIFTVFSFRELMTFASLKRASYQIKGFEIPPNSLVNLIRIVLQKILHAIFILLMMINGAIYQTLMTPNITIIISKNK